MGKKIFVLFALLFVFFQLDSAQVLVGISPKDKTKAVLTLYPEEVSQLELIAFNAGSSSERIEIKISASPGIAFIEKDSEQKAISRQIELSPSERRILELEVKALEESSEAQQVFAVFSDNNSSVGANIKILPSTMKIESIQLQGKRNFGKFRAKASNASNETIQNLRLEMIPQIGIDKITEQLVVDMLGPGESIEKEFEFFVNYNLLEPKTIVLQSSFRDSNGFHVMQRNLQTSALQWQAIEIIIIVIIAATALAILFALSRILKKKPEEKKAEK